jgi:hypothetical protein
MGVGDPFASLRAGSSLRLKSGSAQDDATEGSSTELVHLAFQVSSCLFEHHTVMGITTLLELL